jgi:ABC-type nitrate/sulfonate/bicarbonate transport system permease component
MPAQLSNLRRIIIIIIIIIIIKFCIERRVVPCEKRTNEWTKDIQT